MAYFPRDPETGKLQHPFTALLAVLSAVLVLLAVSEQLDADTIRRLVAHSFVLVSFAGAYVFSSKRHLSLIMFVIGFAFISVSAWGYVAPSSLVNVVSHLLLIIVFIGLTIAVLQRLKRAQRVNGDIVTGTIVAYLLADLSFAFIHSLIVILWPGSYRGLEAAKVGIARSSVYYSYVTLTSLGYGDISPLQPIARTMSYFETLFGQGFMAIVVARFVGQGIADFNRQDDPDKEKHNAQMLDAEDPPSKKH